MQRKLLPYLKPTYFIDSDNETIIELAESACRECSTEISKATALYYKIRDSIRYDPYDLEYSREAMRASSIVLKQSGYCVAKAVVLAAVARQQGIPSRLGFADVTNHLSTPKLRKLMGTNLFIYHGYTEMFLAGRWVKATPAFNLELCDRFKVKPLDFDGTTDSIFHEYDALGQKHMEYVHDHGTFEDLPFERIFTAYGRVYPNFFENFGSSKTTTGIQGRDKNFL